MNQWCSPDGPPVILYITWNKLCETSVRYFLLARKELLYSQVYLNMSIVSGDIPEAVQAILINESSTAIEDNPTNNDIMLPTNATVTIKLPADKLCIGKQDLGCSCSLCSPAEL